MVCVFVAAPGVAFAQGLVPADFFNAPVDPSAPSEVEAATLTFDLPANIIQASGEVVLRQAGYVLSGDRLIYNRETGELTLLGNVTVTDPAGNTATMESLKVGESFRRAFLESVAIVGYDGSMITAESVDYDEALQTLLSNATYSPCGECIDQQGRRIGWSMRADRIVYNTEDGSVAFEQPQLALLGLPVAWLPYLWLPDLSDSALSKVRAPSIDYSEEIGLKLEVPVTVFSSRYADVILSPTLVSRQGFLVSAEWVQRFDMGQFYVKASGLRQGDPTAFTYLPSQTEWRGAIQTAGQFKPADEWTLGWSYSAFTDLAYFEDYRIDPRSAAIDEVYAVNVTSDTFIDARMQQFNILGKTALTRQQEQGIALPNIRFERRFDLGPEAGVLDVTGKLLGVRRETDSVYIQNGVPYVFGYAGNKLHGMLEADWRRQMIFASGVVMTPFAGLRVDAATYDNASVLAGAPAATTLVWSATPIAALDIRYPLMARGAGVTHVIKPVAQIVYRGSSNPLPGITNDDSQSSILNDTNLFSFNRFSGFDRQETGLRANVGVLYSATFDNGSWLDLVGGQSFHLAGVNAFAAPDQVLTGLGSGLEDVQSYAVLAAYGSFIEGVEFGAKVQIDPQTLSIARAHAQASLATELVEAGLHYRFNNAIPASGTPRDEHEVGVELKMPVAEYWSISSSTYWDLDANSWLLVGGGLTYDDDYLEIGGYVSRTGRTHYKPDDTRIFATFMLKAPAGAQAGYTGELPSP